MSEAIKTRSESMYDLQVRVDKASKDRRMTDRSMMSVEMGDVKNAISEVTSLRSTLQGATDMVNQLNRVVTREDYVHQTKFGLTPWTPDHGNCFPACLATILGLPLEEVPNIYSVCRDIDHANYTLAEFLGKRGFHLAHYPTEVVLNGMKEGWFYAGDEHTRVVVIVTGKSPRFEGQHAVVGVLNPNNVNGWDLLHDPHPDGTGVTDVIGFEILSRPMRAKV